MGPKELRVYCLPAGSMVRIAASILCISLVPKRENTSGTHSFVHVYDKHTGLPLQECVYSDDVTYCTTAPRFWDGNNFACTILHVQMVDTLSCKPGNCATDLQ